MQLGGGAGLMSGGGTGAGGLIFGNPKYSGVPLDSGTEELLNEQANRAESMGEEDYAKHNLRGTHSTFDQSAMDNSARALGGPSDDAMKAAIQQRSQRAMDMGLNQLQREAQVASVGQKAQQMKNAFTGAAGLQEEMSANSLAEMQAHQNNQQTRSSIISSIFGGAGMMAGKMGGGGANNPAAAGQAAGGAGGFGGQSGGYNLGYGGNYDLGVGGK